MKLTLLKKLFWVVGVALFAAGLYGWYDRFVYGHLHANYGTIVPWGLWVASYIYFIGLSAGSPAICARPPTACRSHRDRRWRWSPPAGAVVIVAGR